MIQVIALIGEAGSGKDFVAKKLTENSRETNLIVSATTRPQREGEIDGKDYYFWSYEQFTDAVMNNQMLEATVFNGWGYGTPLSALKKDKVNIGVFNPAGVRSLLDFPNDIDLTVYYLKVSSKERLLRQLNREENPDVDEIIRRYGTDQKDFLNLDFNYTTLLNEYPEDLDKIYAGITGVILDNLYTRICI